MRPLNRLRLRRRELGHQLLLAHHDLLANRLEVHVALLELREVFLLLLLDVVLDLFRQHLDLGVVHLVGRLHRLDFGHQLLGRVVFDDRLVDDLLVLHELA